MMKSGEQGTQHTPHLKLMNTHTKFLANQVLLLQHPLADGFWCWDSFPHYNYIISLGSYTAYSSPQFSYLLSYRWESEA